MQRELIKLLGAREPGARLEAPPVDAVSRQEFREANEALQKQIRDGLRVFQDFADAIDTRVTALEAIRRGQLEPDEVQAIETNVRAVQAELATFKDEIQFAINNSKQRTDQSIADLDAAVFSGMDALGDGLAGLTDQLEDIFQRLETLETRSGAVSVPPSELERRREAERRRETERLRETEQERREAEERRRSAARATPEERIREQLKGSLSEILTGKEAQKVANSFLLATRAVELREGTKRRLRLEAQELSGQRTASDHPGSLAILARAMSLVGRAFSEYTKLKDKFVEEGGVDTFPLDDLVNAVRDYLLSLAIAARRGMLTLKKPAEPLLDKPWQETVNRKIPELVDLLLVEFQPSGELRKML